MKRLITLVLLAVLLTGTALQAQDAARSAPPNPVNVRLVPVAQGFNRPLFATGAGDGSGRIFVAEQGGQIWVIKEGQRVETPFLDVSSLITRDVFTGEYTERGFLGLAFHPDYANNRQFFVYYTDLNGNSVVARYLASANNPDTADPGSAVIILTQQQPNHYNHKGGNMAFGPDGYLYIGLGDGGSQGDPNNYGQNLGTLLGKILRIDVNNTNTYTVPSDNPFVGQSGVKPEIWAYGFREPWRFSFDRATGDLYIGEVGQDLWEEVDFQPAGDPGGQNYGWSLYEGNHPFKGGDASQITLPVTEYSHSVGISVTGGYVYRGAQIPDLVGAYLYADFGTGAIWSLYRDANGQWVNNVFMKLPSTAISAFGEGDDGELYLVNYNGAVLRFEPAG